MKLLALLLCALSLLPATAADARHHHRHNNHVAVPMPKERPVTTIAWVAPAPSITEQLVLVGMWRLQNDPFYREARR